MLEIHCVFLSNFLNVCALTVFLFLKDDFSRIALMIKSFSTFIFLLLSFSVFNMAIACPSATPTNSASFCSSFKAAAECHCTSAGLPRGMCTNMKDLYNRMIGIYGSVQRACAFQHDTSAKECMDDWHCYRDGGKNANGQLCSSTGSACE